MIFQRSVQFVIDYRRVILILLLFALISGLGQTWRHLEVDNSLSIWFLEDNEDFKEYLSFQEEQGSDEVIIAMIPTEDALAKSHVAQLEKLHERADSVPYVVSSFSIANAKYPIYSNQKIYYRNIYKTERSRESIAGILDELPALSRQLITEDLRYSFFYLQLIPSNQLEYNRKQIIAQLQDLIESSFEDSYVSGAPILNEAYNLSIYRESIFFTVVSVLVIFVLLLFLLPHWHYLPIAFFAITLPVSLTLGLMVSLGYSLNLISMLIPTILMIYSVSDLIHVINIFHQHRKEHPLQSRTEQITIAFRKSLKPCFYSTLTTIIGYLALVLSPLPAFKTMGLFTFVGLVAAFLLVYLIAAIGFTFLDKKSLSANVQKINISAITQKINHWTSNYSGLIMGVGAMIFILGTISLFSIEVSTISLNLLANGKVKDDLHVIEETLGGSNRLQLNIYSLKEETLLETDVLELLKQFQEKLEQNELISHPISLVNFQSFLEKRMSTLSKISSVNLGKVLKNNMEESNAFFSLFGEDFSYAAININIKELETKELEQLILSIQNDFNNTFPADEYGLKIHGFSALFTKINSFILQTQFRSFGAAFCISFCILFYFIGQFRMSFLVLIPNLIPIFAALILMNLLGIHLEAANAMLAPIMLGVAMDDTIHLINKFKFYQDENLSTAESINKALNYTGGALIATTISLVCGFLIVGLSGIVAISTFGLLCAFTILIALLTDVILLPTLLKRFYKKR